MGVVSPVGNTPDTFFNALKKVSGVLPTGDTTPIPVTTTLLNEVALINR